MQSKLIDSSRPSPVRLSRFKNINGCGGLQALLIAYRAHSSLLKRIWPVIRAVGTKGGEEGWREVLDVTLVSCFVLIFNIFGNIQNPRRPTRNSFRLSSFA